MPVGVMGPWDRLLQPNTCDRRLLAPSVGGSKSVERSRQRDQLLQSVLHQVVLLPDGR